MSVFVGVWWVWFCLFTFGRYDLGLLKRIDGPFGPFVKPVNRLAENVLYDIYALECSARDLTLSSEVDEGAKGVIFQRQVFTFICCAPLT